MDYPFKRQRLAKNLTRPNLNRSDARKGGHTTTATEEPTDEDDDRACNSLTATSEQPLASPDTRGAFQQLPLRVAASHSDHRSGLHPRHHHLHRRDAPVVVSILSQYKSTAASTGLGPTLVAAVAETSSSLATSASTPSATRLSLLAPHPELDATAPSSLSNGPSATTSASERSMPRHPLLSTLASIAPYVSATAPIATSTSQGISQASISSSTASVTSPLTSASVTSTSPSSSASGRSSSTEAQASSSTSSSTSQTGAQESSPTHVALSSGKVPGPLNS